MTTDSRVLTSDADTLSHYVLYEELGSTTYEGRASRTNAAASAPLWQIKRTVIVGAVKSVQYANHGQSNCIWDNRAAYFSGVVLPYSNAKSTLFDGVNDYVDLACNTLPVFGSNSSKLTLSAWVKVLASGSNRAIFSRALSTITTRYVQFYVTSSNTLALSVNGHQMFTSYLTPLTIGVWTHVAIMKDGTTSYLVVNGVIVETGIYEAAVAYVDDVASIGSLRRATASAWFEGNIDEVAIFDVILSSGQLAEIYNSGKPTNLLTHSMVGNLKALYRMGDVDTFPSIVDQKGTNHGTMLNMVASAFVIDTP